LDKIFRHIESKEDNWSNGCPGSVTTSVSGVNDSKESENKNKFNIETKLLGDMSYHLDDTNRDSLSASSKSGLPVYTQDPYRQ
jgi:hypothetical protein